MDIHTEVLLKEGTQMKNFDIEAVCFNFRSGERVIMHDSRPLFKVTDDYLTEGLIWFEDGKDLEFGEKKVCYIKFITPEAYPAIFTIGDQIDIYGYLEKVGYIQITKILNSLLQR